MVQNALTRCGDSWIIVDVLKYRNFCCIGGDFMQKIRGFGNYAKDGTF